jgi:hypothetical protein
VGGGVGPDSGGSGRVFPPQPIGVIIPPTDRPARVRGRVVTARFLISERGEVMRVALDPPTRDRNFNEQFLDRLRRYSFTPAYTLEGRPIAWPYVITFTL